MPSAPAGPARSVVRMGAAARAIVEVALDPAVREIVMAGHNRNPFMRIALGSVTDRVARTAPCPVLIVRGDED